MAGMIKNHMMIDPESTPNAKRGNMEFDGDDPWYQSSGKINR